MEDPVDAAHRAAHGCAVEHVAARHLDVEAGEVVQASTVRTSRRATWSPRSTSSRATCDPTQSRGAGDERDPHGRSVGEPLTAMSRHAEVAIVDRHDALHAARAGRGHDIHEVTLYVNDGRPPEREVGHARLRRLLRGLRSADRAADDLAAVDRRLPRGLRAARRARARHRVRAHLGRHLGHGRVRPPGGDRAVDARERGSAGSRSSTRAARAARSACVALAGAAAARAGGDVDAVAARARAAAAQAKIWFAVDTLEFLRRGGRIGAAQAWLGGALKIKPILTHRGRDHPDRARTHVGARVRADGRLPARRAHDDGATRWVVQHIQAPEQAAAPVERGREIFGSEPVFFAEIGPVIGTHVGPGLLGVGGIPSSLLS